MIPASCPRTWEAEASRDDRLSEGARASFEQHRASCAICRQAADRLDALAQNLRASAPAVDEVASRRLRQRVLRSAYEWTTAGAAGRPRRWKLVAAGAAALALAMLFQLLWADHSAELGSDLITRAEPGAIWSRRPSEGMDEITLFDGALSLEVRHSSAQGASNSSAPARPARVLVRVPDGQILDRGTRFRVVVRGERTREIAVSEGAVLLQRPGLPDVTVERGSTWRVQEAPVTASAAPPQTDAGSASASAAREAEPTTLNRPPRVLGPAPRPGVNSGDHRRARSLQDRAGEAASSAEDAAYLRWISLLRAGRRDAARAAGLDYLRRFPRAFRRAEVEAMVAPLESTPPVPPPL